MTDENLNLLMDAWMAGEMSAEDAALLSDHLRGDEAARERFLQLADVHASLSVDESLWVSQPKVAPPTGSEVVNSWFSRHALAAAAAGIVLGAFFTSIVFASITTRAPKLKRDPIRLGNPGFESPVRDDLIRIPKALGEWSGNVSRITQGEFGVEPIEGQSMVCLAPRGPKESARLFQVIDLTEALPAPRDRTVELELSASFTSASNGFRHLYGIHLLAFDEPMEGKRGKLHSELAADAVASASRLIKVMGDNKQWQTVTVKIEVPPSASQLLICLFARGPSNDAPVAERYVDDVKLFVLSSGFQPLINN